MTRTIRGGLRDARLAILWGRQTHTGSLETARTVAGLMADAVVGSIADWFAGVRRDWGWFCFFCRWGRR